MKVSITPRGIIQQQGDNELIVDIASSTARGEATLDVMCQVASWSTTTATPAAITLYTLADLDVVAVDVVLTVRNATSTKRGRWKLSASVYRQGGSATIEEDTVDSSSKKNDAGLDATIVVSGNDVKLQVTGLAATTLTWGWEVRLQKQKPGS